MSNSEFWANFGKGMFSDLSNLILETKKQEQVSEDQALKEQIKLLEEKIDKLEAEKLQLIRYASVLEYRLQQQEGKE